MGGGGGALCVRTHSLAACVAVPCRSRCVHPCLAGSIDCAVPPKMPSNADCTEWLVPSIPGVAPDDFRFLGPRKKHLKGEHFSWRDDEKWAELIPWESDMRPYLNWSGYYVQSWRLGRCSLCWQLPRSNKRECNNTLECCLLITLRRSERERIWRPLYQS
jgi:hypothetical protein